MQRCYSMIMLCRRLVYTSLAAALVVLPSGPMHAQTKPVPSANTGAPTEAEKAIARQDHTKGSALAKENRWQEAYPFLLKAWERVKHWQTAASLGTVEVELGKYRAAEQHLSFARGAADLPAEERPRIDELLERAHIKLGTIRLKATSQGAAQVFMDDELLGVTPLTGPISADPGTHRLEVRSGERRDGRTVTVATAATQEVSLDLRVPDLDKPISPSEERGAGERGTGPSWPGVIALGGAALVGIGVGAGLWVAADGERSDAQRMFDALPPLGKGACTTPDCKSVHDALAAQATFQTGAAITWGIAGVAAASAVAVWIFTRPSSAKKTGVHVVPVAGPQLGGLMLQGSF
jgi:hypothetical protein